MYTLRLFGSPVLMGPDGPVSGRVAQERKLALLAVLALAEGRSLTRDSLAAMFWPESDPARARHNVADGLWAIRKALGDEALVTRGNRVFLSPEAVATDVEAFDRALRDGDREEAARGYGGPFMKGFHISGAPEFERWLDRERARLADALAGALEALVHESMGAGAASEAVAWARRLAATDPLNTRWTLLLMEALAASGDLAGALRCGEAHGELLEAELGISPPAEVEERIRELRESPPPVASAATTPPAPPTPASPSPGAGPVAPAGSRVDARTGRPAPAPRLSGPVPRRPPGRGWLRLAWILAGVAVAGVFVAWMLPGATFGDAPEVVPDRIVVLSFENRTGDPELELVGRMAADALIRGLTEARIGHIVLPPDLIGAGVGAEGGLRGPEQARAVAREEGAGIAVSGTIHPGPEGPVLEATLSAGPRGRVFAVLGPEPLEPGGIVSALDRLASRAVGSVAAYLGQAAPELPFVVWTPSYESYRTADRATALFLQFRYQEAAALYREAYALDPGAVGYLVWEAISHMNRSAFGRAEEVVGELRPRRSELGRFDAIQLDWLEADLRGDIAGALQATRRAQDLHPHSGVGGFQVGSELLRSGRPDEALHVLLALDPDRGWLAGLQFYWTRVASAYHLLGRHEEELTAAEEGYRRHGNFGALTARIRALAALGRIPEITEAIRESTNPPQHAIHAARALHRHGHQEAAVAMAEEGLRTLRAGPPAPEAFPAALPARRNTEARLLLAAGRYDEARGVFLELLAGQPTNHDLLGWLGFAEARLGMEDAARERIRTLRTLAGEPYRFGGPTVARAAIHAELGDDPAWIRLMLEQSHREGWPLDFFHYTPLFDPVREHPDVLGFFQLPR